MTTTLLHRSRKTLLALALLGALGLGGMIGTNAANAAAANNCTYYSDATYTTVVGRYGYDCCNNRVAWGVKTQFAQCSQACFLCTPPPPGFRSSEGIRPVDDVRLVAGGPAPPPGRAGGREDSPRSPRSLRASRPPRSRF